MIDPVSVQALLRVAALWAAKSAGPPFRAERALEEAFADSLDGITPRSGGAPDVVVIRPDMSSDLAVEIIIPPIRTWEKNRTNRISDLISRSVLYRRGAGREATVAAIVAVPEVDADALVSGESIAKDLEPVLRSEADGVGYDLLLVGNLASIEPWRVRTARGAWQAMPLVDALEFAKQHEAPWTSPAVGMRSGRDLSKGSLEVLCVADEWVSSKGGASTLASSLASALAAAGCSVTVVVPRFTEAELVSASNSNVRLVRSDPVPGFSDGELLATRPVALGAGYSPDVIIGHGRFLGPYAFALQQNSFPAAVRVHVVHTNAEFMESYKETRAPRSQMQVASKKKEIEVALAASADLVVGVGPLLTEAIADDMRGYGEHTPQILELWPGLRDWGAVVDKNDPPARNQVLVVGRAGDVVLKGIDLAAEATAWASSRIGNDPHKRPSLAVRGVPEHEEDALRARLENMVSPGVSVLLRPYSSSEATLRPDFWQAKVVLMPSRHEGFGLAAYEAIAAGVPVLISAESGLAKFLTGSLGLVDVPEIMPVIGTEAEILELWGSAVLARLEDPSFYFARAAELREAIAEKVTWGKASVGLIEAVRALAKDSTHPQSP